MSIAESIQFIVAMAVMMNPLGSLSIFLDLTKNASLAEKRTIACHTGMAIIVIMLMSIWVGRELLHIFGITIPAFRFAGGIILLLVGLSMLQSQDSPIRNTPEDMEAAKGRESIAIVPLAVPIIVGPGVISTLVLAAGDHSEYGAKLWLSILCLFLSIVMGALLYYATHITRLVGVSVIKVVTRIMGMIIMSIAVGMLMDGLVGLLPILHQH
jgi:multiple antibiotic resistance protein